MRGIGSNIVQRDSELYQILTLLADPKQLQKNLDALMTEQDKMQEKIDRFALAEEIEKVHARLDEDVEASRIKTAEADERIEKLLGVASTECDQLIERAESRAAEMLDSAQTKLADATERERVAGKKLSETERTVGELAQREKQIERQAADLERKLAATEGLQTQLLKEKSELATVRESIQAAVG